MHEIHCILFKLTSRAYMSVMNKSCILKSLGAEIRSLFVCQMYRGRLGNGTLVAIRSLKVKRNQSSLSFSRHIETISRLRHRNLVSALGHCFEYDLDDSTVTQLYLVFEYVQNGNLRCRISRMLNCQLFSFIVFLFSCLQYSVTDCCFALHPVLIFTRRN